MQIGNFNIGKGLVITVILVALGIFVASTLISFNNSDKRIRADFKKYSSDETAAFDKMKKTIGGVAQVTAKSEQGFLEVVKAQMEMRKDADGLAMKWIQEANPAATYAQVLDMFKNLSRVIESERASFFDRETRMSSIVQQHDYLISQFPGSLYAWILGVKTIEYQPITSTATQEAVKTRKDDDNDVFGK